MRGRAPNIAALQLPVLGGLKPKRPLSFPVVLGGTPAGRAFILGLEHRLGREEQRLRIWKDFPLGLGWGPDFATSGSYCFPHPAAERSRFGN